MIPVNIAVNFPVKSSVLTYGLVKEEDFMRGKIVQVPLGKRKALGCMLEINKETPDFKLKEVDPDGPWSYLLSERELELYDWMAKYYHYSLGQLIFDCLPKIMKRPKKIDFNPGEGKFPKYELSSDQESVFNSIVPALNSGFSQHYIHGVTGSGKTFIYLHLIKKLLSEGKSSVFLLPEINLTPQFVQHFKEVLSCPVIPYHSALSASEKFTAWNFLKASNEAVLILGVRSSVFLPVNNLGLIVVDEEHDSSFKQNDRCAYHARDVAIKKAQIHNVPILLGSATPSLENYERFKFQNPKNYYELRNRVQGTLPQVEIINETQERSEENYPLVERSISLIREALSKKEQVLIFVNRLGFANFLQCRSCGHKFMDPQTDTPLRLFKQKGILSSSHSEFSMPIPIECPECNNMKMLNVGYGTEKVQEVLSKIIKDAKVERFDRDVITTQNKLEECLGKFHNGEIDILVGTQMLSKGHNFKNVNTVIILGADQSLNFPDFRATEKTYQLLTQVLGRCGRFSDSGKVYIQSLTPEIDLFETIKKHEFNEFYEGELPIRKMVNFPPYVKMAKVYISSTKRNEMVDYMESFKHNLCEYNSKNSFNLEIFGPAPAAIERKKHHFTWYFTVKGKNRNYIHNLLDFFDLNFKFKHHFSMKIDVDPDLAS